jgi:hypothetical protein
MVKTDPQKVLDEIRKTLILSTRQTRKAKTISSDKLKNISRLANSYVKLLALTGTKESKPERDPMEHGQADFYESINAD